jgi:hypothetical protein
MPTTPTTRRHFLRYRLRTLLLLPLVFALGWWWVTWPQRTMGHLDALVAANRLDEAAALIEFEPKYRLAPHFVAQQLGQPHIGPASRGFADLLLGRQRFEIYDKGVSCWVDTGNGFEHVMIESVTVERGRINIRWGPTMTEWIRLGK